MATDRDGLGDRPLAAYEKGQASDPASVKLTAPFLPSSSMSDQPPTARAAARFAVRGNAIVTGGAGDIASVACRALLEHGLAGLTIWDLNPATMAEKAAKLQAEFPDAQVRFARVDVTDAAQVEAEVAAAASAFGSVDVLLHCAGIPAATHAMEQDPAEWRSVLEVNATGSFICSTAVARQAVAAGRPASIILTASVSGTRVNFPHPQAAYNASKAAVKHTAASLAAEWARYGIRVNTLSPGYMDTILCQGEGLRAAREVWNDINAFGRMGNPEELCGAIVLLASGAGSYITGHDLVVDGGQTLFC